MTDWGRMTPVDEAALQNHYERMASLRRARGQAVVPYGSYVHHIDGDPANNDPANLLITGGESTLACLCGDEWEYCDIHVHCDTNCKALANPVTVDELRAAVEHWRSHEYTGGCSHGN